MRKILKKNRFLWVLWGVFYVFVFFLLLKSSFGYLDPDLGWHLKVGEEIALTASVPDVNHYNYTFTGNWVDHEWLSNVLAYAGYSRWGYIFLSVIFALLIVGVLIILNFWARRAYPGMSSFLIMFFQLFGVAAAMPHFGVRMQESGVLLLALSLLVIYFYNERRDWRLLIVLPPLIYLWACLHGSFLVGLAIFFAWAGVKILEKILFRYYKKDWLDFSGALTWREIIIFIGAALLSAAGTLFTPYKLGLYSFLIGYKDRFYQGHIQEWLSQFHYPFQYPQLLYLALVLLAVFFYIYYSRGRKRYWRLDLWTLGLTLLFVYLSFSSRRHFPLMFVATFVFLIDVFGRLLRIEAGAPVKAGGGRTASIWVYWYISVCLLLSALLQLVGTKFISNPFTSSRYDYPVGAVEYLRTHPQYDSWRLFNDYGWGGYLIWAMPERRLFIDGRLPQVAYRDKTFLEEYLNFFRKGTDVSRKLAEYDVSLILLPLEDREIKARPWERVVFGLGADNLAAHNYLRDYLVASRDWQAIYYDRTAIIYKRLK